MNHWETSVCKTNGISMHYTRTGGDKPPIILLHGLMANGLCWSGFAGILEKDFDVIMPDARGHGQSSVPDFGYSYKDHADDVIGLIDALELTNCTLLGHSMGGMTAAVVASRKPAQLRCLVLADPTFISPEMQREVRDSDVADQHRRYLAMSSDEVAADVRIRHPNRLEETILLYAQARLQTSMAAFDVLTPPNPDFRMLVGDIDVPSLIIYGDKGVVTSDVAAELQNLNPHLQAVLIEGAGHSLHLDQPERFSNAVLSFMTSIEDHKATYESP